MPKTLSERQNLLVKIYMAGCCHHWGQLPDLATKFYAVGGSIEQLRGCIRHLVVLAGHGPCLAATLTLHKAKLLPENTPAKCGGSPGNAFELVYSSITDVVRRKVHTADPCLGEWIRIHLYGDVYSSPGLNLREKQLLMCAALAEADMNEQLFGHALAGMRFGLTPSQITEAISIGFTTSSRARSEAALREALHTVEMARLKFEKDHRASFRSWEDQGEVECPTVECPEPETLCIPPLPPPWNNSHATNAKTFVWDDM